MAVIICDNFMLLCVVSFFTAKDVGSLSPADSASTYYHPSRKQKYYWRSKLAKQVAVTEQVADATPAYQGSASSSWSVSGTSQWQYPTDVIVNTASDLLHLQQFLVGKAGFACELHMLGAMHVFIYCKAVFMGGQMVHRWAGVYWMCVCFGAWMLQITAIV